VLLVLSFVLAVVVLLLDRDALNARDKVADGGAELLLERAGDTPGVDRSNRLPPELLREAECPAGISDGQRSGDLIAA
jgi:hypothetical protein